MESTNRKVCHFITCQLFLVLWPLFSFSISTPVITGSVMDSLTKEPLPYAILFNKTSSSGCMTDTEGKFRYPLPEKFLLKDTISISCFGYKSIYLIIQRPIKDTLLPVFLSPSVMELQEVQVQPFPPTYYIHRARKNIGNIRSKSGYNALGYYNEEVRENGKVLRSDQAVFKCFHPSPSDTVRRQYQLLLYRQPLGVTDMTFMKEERLKSEKKEYEGKKEIAEKRTGIDFIFNSGGPVYMFRYASINRWVDDYLDSSAFKHYNYAFAYGQGSDNEMMVIDFSSKGVVHHLKKYGKIYIHLPTNSILKIEGGGEIVLPTFLKPLMFLYGFGTQELTFKGTKEFQLIGDTWYFHRAKVSAKIEVSKRHLFSSNEHAVFDGKQELVFFKINEGKGIQIPKSIRYDPEKIMKNQVQSDTLLQWEDVQNFVH